MNGSSNDASGQVHAPPPMTAAEYAALRAEIDTPTKVEVKFENIMMFM
jgi:hypothetical protein